jgi:hypothetical protein
VINIEAEIGQIEFIRKTLMSEPPMLARRTNHLVMCLSFVKLARDRAIALKLTDRFHIQQCTVGFDFEWLRGDGFAASLRLLPYNREVVLDINY